MDLITALAIAKSLLGITGTESDDELSSLLEASKGQRPSEIEGEMIDEYRPYIVAASYIPFRYSLANKGIIEADGVKWLKPNEWLDIARGLANLQKAADCKLTVDPCWSVNAILDQINCNDECHHQFAAMLI